MGTYEELLQNYALNEHILKSKSADYGAKNSAWRQQAVILQHLTRDTCAATQHTALQQHAKKLSYEDEASILQKRAAAVDALLGGFSSPIEEPTTSYPQLSELDDIGSILESDCRGSYQSCRHVEMTEDILQRYRGADAGNDSDPSIRVGDSAFAQHHSSINSVKCGKNTLSAYLQPKAPPPTTKIDAADVPGHSNRGECENWQEQQLPRPKVIDKQNEYSSIGFRTAREELFLRNMKKNSDPNGCNGNNSVPDMPLLNYGLRKKSLGARRILNSNSIPFRTEGVRSTITSVAPPTTTHQPSTQSTDNSKSIPQQADERLKNIDPKMIEMITNEIIHKNEAVDWDDIAGLDYAKSILKEAVVYPLLRPDIFTGLRRPPRGILLFGPPGTGKTLIGKCIASKSQSTFFSISASSLTSKWMGDGEKMVRALFAVAVAYQPSVVFIDEIDSLLSQRSELDHESSRRLKTEFLVQLDGASTSKDDRVLIVGATNRPQELDEAARRRLVRRLYIPLPELEARIQILTNLLKTVSNSLTNETVREIGNLTAGYSCADMESLCGEASMEPIRTIPADQIPYFKMENVRPMNMQDFMVALQRVRPSVSENALDQYTEWNRIYGAGN